jgi:predicted nucleic acid-binding protein
MKDKSAKKYDDFLFNDFQREVDQKFTELIHNFPAELTNYIKTKIHENTSLFNNNSFELELIADTNIIFSEVRSLMVNKSSFFLKISANPYVKIYAPSVLKTELYEKIKLKFPKDRKTKDFEIHECLKTADLLLSKINIRDDITITSFNKAKSYMEKRDAKDIPFVALNLSLKTHGILTKDRDISDIEEIKTWKLGEAGKVITEIHKGSFLFLILNTSLPQIWKVISELVSIIWVTFINIIEGLIIFFRSILTKSIEGIAKMPPELSLIIGIAAIFLLVADKLRNELGEFLLILWKQIKKIIQIVKSVFKAIWETLKDIYEALKPLLSASSDLLTYFTIQSLQAMNRLDQLEMERPL